MTAIVIPAPRPTRHGRILVLLLAASLIIAVVPLTEQIAAPPRPDVRTPLAAAHLAGLPLSFIPNQGQAAQRFALLSLPGQLALGFTDHGMVMRPGGAQGGGAVRHAFVGGAAVTPIAVTPQVTRYSRFTGERESWVTGAQVFGAVRYEDVWPGIDAVYRGSASQLKYRFVIAPGADPSQIRMRYTGATTTLTAGGELNIASAGSSFTDEAPISYQADGPVSSAYRLANDGSYRFELGAYDASAPLVIDPTTVIYAGFIAGVSDDIPYAIAVDATGAAYITGRTNSMGEFDLFPVTGGLDATGNGGSYDVFIAKINPAGDAIVYAGFLGGDGSEEGRGIAVDGNGAAYVTGWTDSTQATFPLVNDTFQTHGGGVDAFVARVSPDGTALTYSGYIGGNLNDTGRAIAVDGSGNAYVTGHTTSTEATFPESGGPDTTYNGNRDAFVAKIAGTGAVSYAGYIGGTSDDQAWGIAVDALGAAYVVGTTQSSEISDGFPVLGGPDTTYNGGTDAFVSKVAPNGSALSYSGYVGGTSNDEGAAIAVDATGAAYITGAAGSTQAQGFPASGGPSLTLNGAFDAYVAKINAAGTGIVWAGYVGGTDYDYGTGIAVDSAHAVTISGRTSSSEAQSFPVTDGPDLTFNGGGTDGFVARVVPSGSSLVYAGYVGDSSSLSVDGVAVDGTGNAYVTGAVWTDFVGVGGLSTHVGGPEAAVVKVSGTVAASYQPDAQIKKGTAAYTGDDIYAADAANESIAAKVRIGKTVTMSIRIENDGSTDDAFLVDGCAKAGKLKPTYFAGATNVTTAVVDGSYDTGSLTSGATDDLIFKVKASSRAKRGQKIVCLVSTTSGGDGGQIDAVKATVTVR